jgi:hypothetical protein
MKIKASRLILTVYSISRRYRLDAVPLKSTTITRFGNGSEGGRRTLEWAGGWCGAPDESRIFLTFLKRGGGEAFIQLLGWAWHRIEAC